MEELTHQAPHTWLDFSFCTWIDKISGKNLVTTMCSCIIFLILEIFVKKSSNIILRWFSHSVFQRGAKSTGLSYKIYALY